MYQKSGRFDALVSATGSVHFDALSEMTAEKYALGLQSK